MFCIFFARTIDYYLVFSLDNCIVFFLVFARHVTIFVNDILIFNTSKTIAKIKSTLIPRTFRILIVSCGFFPNLVFRTNWPNNMDRRQKIVKKDKFQRSFLDFLQKFIIFFTIFPNLNFLC